MRDRSTSLGSMAVAVLGTLAFTGEARADDGPLYALGRMMDASPTLTLVTSSVVILADASFTTVDGIAATKNQDLGLGLSAMEVAVATPQALGFALAPFFFDIHRWETAETVGLLIPFQAWSAALATHGIWSLASDPVEQPGRVGASFLIGANWAFTTTALGCLSFGKPSPMGVAALQIGITATSAGFTIFRAVDDDVHGAEWGALSAWSLFLLGHGIASAVIDAKESNDGYAARGPERRLASIPVPTFQMRDGAYTFGALGAF